MAKKITCSIWGFFFIFLFAGQGQAAMVKDVPNTHWASAAIQQVISQQIMTTKDGYFQPTQKMTRQEIAVAIQNAIANEQTCSISLVARDVSWQHEAYPSFCLLVEKRVLENSELLRPEKLVTRAEMAKMIALAFHIEVDQKNVATFSDYTKSFWAKHYIESMADARIMTGTSAQRFSPQATITKAEVASLIVRAQTFQKQLASFSIAYDFLGKQYIETALQNEKWVQEVVRLVNVERKSVGVPALTAEKSLHQLCTIKVKDMISRQYFEHRSPYYGNPWDMATLFDYEFTSFGENIASGFATPEKVVKAWMASSTHKQNIVKASYTHIGVAVRKNAQGTYFWVQQFSSH